MQPRNNGDGNNLNGDAIKQLRPKLGEGMVTRRLYTYGSLIQPFFGRPISLKFEWPYL